MWFRRSRAQRRLKEILDGLPEQPKGAYHVAPRLQLLGIIVRTVLWNAGETEVVTSQKKTRTQGFWLDHTPDGVIVRATSAELHQRYRVILRQAFFQVPRTDLVRYRVRQYVNGVHVTLPSDYQLVQLYDALSRR